MRIGGSSLRAIDGRAVGRKMAGGPAISSIWPPGNRTFITTTSWRTRSKLFWLEQWKIDLGRDDSRVAIGQTAAGPYLRVIYVPDPESSSVFVITAYELGSKALKALPSAPTEEDMKQTNFPPGWDEARVRRVLEHYEGQSDDEAIAEDEAAYESTTHTAMEVPVIWSRLFANSLPNGASARAG